MSLLLSSLYHIILSRGDFFQNTVTEEVQRVYEPFPIVQMDTGRYSYEFAVALDSTFLPSVAFQRKFGFERFYAVRGTRCVHARFISQLHLSHDTTETEWL